MYSTLFTTTLVFALLALRARAEFSVDTVKLTQCQPATLGWEKTNGPYNVIVVASSDPCGNPLVDLGDHDSNELKWPKVNVTAGSKVMISVLDNKDEEGWSGVITVKQSDDKSCLASNGGTPSHSSSHSSSSPTSSPTPHPPTPTVVGAANAGLGSGGPATIHLSGVAVALTAFCALAALF